MGATEKINSVPAETRTLVKYCLGRNSRTVSYCSFFSPHFFGQLMTYTCGDWFYQHWRRLTSFFRNLLELAFLRCKVEASWNHFQILSLEHTVCFPLSVYRITDWLRLEGTSGCHLVQPPLLKQGHLEPVVQDHVQTAFEYVQRWRLYNLSGQSMPVLSHLHG